MMAPLGALQSGATIIGVGARCATGLTALQVTMSVRAGKSQLRESHVVDRTGEPVAVCRLASIGDDLMGAARYVPLAAPALAEAVSPWASVQRARGPSAPLLPLILAVPDAMSPRDARELLAAVSAASGVAIELDRSRVVAQGRAGGVAALELAIARLARGDDEVIAVGGVDSWFEAGRLEALDLARRLNGPACENGFVPGEASGFVVLSRGGRSGVRSCGRIVGTAMELEPRPYGSEEPCQGLAMTAAVKRALGAARVEWALTDVVGERHRVEEWLYVSGRLHTRLAPNLRHDQPLLKTGDLGAASALTLLVLACVSWETGASGAPSALVLAHSDGPERGAVLVVREQDP